MPFLPFASMLIRRRPLALLALLLLTLFASAASAAPLAEPARDPVLDQIALDEGAGLLDTKNATMQRFYRVFGPEWQAPRYASDAPQGGPPCATELLASVRGIWELLDGTERHRVELKTSPFYRQWLSEGGISWEQGDVQAAQATARATCFSPSILDQGPYENIDEEDHFVIHWNASSLVNQGRIDDLGQWLEESYGYFVGELGMYPPNRMPQYQLLVMVEDMNNPSIGAYTTIYGCQLNDYMAYIVINAAWFEDSFASPGTRLQSTAPHEFFHAVQMSYGFAEFFQSQGSRNRWIIEASSTYAETLVYPGNAGHLSQTFRWSATPYRTLETADNTGFQYGLYIWFMSLETSLGRSGWFRELWDSVQGDVGYLLRDKFDEVLGPHGSDFLTEFGLYAARSARMDFPHNELPWDLPGPSDLEGWSDYYTNGTTAEHDEGDLPLEVDVNNASGLERAEYLGVNHVLFDARGIGDDEALHISFHGAGHKDGEAVQWNVELVAVVDEGRRDFEYHHLELVADRDQDDEIAAWDGEVLLNDFGEDYEQLYLVVSPVNDYGSTEGVSWSYAAELVENQTSGGFSTVDAGDEAIDDMPEPSGAGCSTGAGCSGQPSLAWLLLFGGLGLGRRRERR